MKKNKIKTLVPKKEFIELSDEDKIKKSGLSEDSYKNSRVPMRKRKK